MVSLKTVQLLALSATAAALSGAAAMPRVDPGVHRSLRQQATVNLMVTLKDSTKPVINAVQEADHGSRGDKIEDLVKRLKKHAETSQSEVNKALAKESTTATPLFKSAKSHWISNQISFEGASFELVEKLAMLASISEIREEIVLPSPTINLQFNTTADVVTSTVKNQWGVTKIQVSDVWAAGYNGQGVVVGHIDTGAHFTHEALRANFRGAYGWFDPTANKPEPYDDSGHGTMTLGNLAGSQGIGAAPGATWMSCRTCTLDEGCRESYALACGEFITCPTDPAGNNRDCSKAPPIVSNSWGGVSGQTFFDAVIDTWRAAGIIPVFANGNSGPECSTANYPGDSPKVIAVGMTDRFDGLDFQSSKGPSIAGLVKPDITAPGSSVRSAYPSEENDLYLTSTGSSLAAPFVSGVIAILLSANPALKYDDVKKILTSTTDTATLTETGYTCGETVDTTFPNNQYGYGRLNSLKAYNLATNSNATPVPTMAPSICDGKAFFTCFRTPGCQWGDLGECEEAPPAASSGSGSGEAPTDTPTEAPTDTPTEAPTDTPTEGPTNTPTERRTTAA